MVLLSECIATDFKKVSVFLVSLLLFFTGVSCFLSFMSIYFLVSFLLFVITTIFSNEGNPELFTNILKPGKRSTFLMNIFTLDNRLND